MPILRPTKIEGKVHTVLVNGKPDQGIATERVGTVNVSYEGFEGDWHSGLTRESCVRVRRQYKDGTEIRNTRQVSIISVEDMETIAGEMGVTGLEPEWLGANILLSGIPDFTLVPPSSRLIFPSGASLVVDMENEPCKYPGDVIEENHPGYGSLFAKNALNLRGITAWVEREGTISEGDAIALHVPPQRIYDYEQG
jgi:hypothetical protein